MAAFLKVAFQQRPNINKEECKLLLHAYQNLVGLLRASWRVSCGIEGRKTETDLKRKAAMAQRKRIVGETVALVEEVVALAASLGPHCTEEKVQLSLMKMTADYLRYAAEATDGALQCAYLDRTLRAYNVLMARTCTLQPLDPVRLCSALNTAVFHHDLLLDAPFACDIIHRAFKEALNAELDQDRDAEAIQILTLLRENISLWMADWGWPEDIYGPHKIP